MQQEIFFWTLILLASVVLSLAKMARLSSPASLRPDDSSWQKYSTFIAKLKLYYNEYWLWCCEPICKSESIVKELETHGKCFRYHVKVNLLFLLQPSNFGKSENPLLQLQILKWDCFLRHSIGCWLRYWKRWTIRKQCLTQDEVMALDAVQKNILAIIKSHIAIREF